MMKKLIFDTAKEAFRRGYRKYKRGQRKTERVPYDLVKKDIKRSILFMMRRKIDIYLRMVRNGLVTFVSSHGGLMNLTPGGGAKPFPPGNKKKG